MSSTITTSIGRGSVPREPPAVAVDVIGGAIVNNIGSGFVTTAVSGTEFSATSGYIGGVFSGYALSGGSTHVGGLWPMQAGFWSGTTDANGQAAITFPYAFKNTPTSVVATVEGYDYVCRIVSGTRTTTGFTVKVLQVGVNWTSGAVLGSGLNITTALALTSAPVTNLAHVPAGSTTFTQTHNQVITNGTISTLYAASGSALSPVVGFGALGTGSVLSDETTPVMVGLAQTVTDNTVVASIAPTADSFTKSGITTNSGVAVVSVSGFLTAAASVSANIDWIAAA